MAKILIADDSADNVDILAEYLGGAGYDIVAAGNAADAVARAASDLPDVILMDLQMPDSAVVRQLSDDAGLDATRKLRADPATAAIPIIALSGHDTASRSEAITLAGCNAAVSKPFKLTALLALIEQFVPTR